MPSFATTAMISRVVPDDREAISFFVPPRKSGTQPPAKRVVVVLRTERCD